MGSNFRKGPARAWLKCELEMPKVREVVEIKAPGDRVWVVVHEDPTNAPKWSTNLERVETRDKRHAKGSRYRYHILLPGGLKTILECATTLYNKPKKCAGVFTDGPLKGIWSYTYKEKGENTVLVYEMDFELGGLLRFASGALARQYAEGIHGNMLLLKRYVESGKGPRAKS